MLAALESLCTLTGDALVAVAAALRTRREGFSDYEAGDFLIAPTTTPLIPRETVRSALDELSDSKLLTIAANLIDSWAPILLKTTRRATDVDLLVAALRDRASQFAAIEADADRPFLTPVHLGAPQPE